ncbi:4-hydroxy-tetrahydrodipicolinate reductase [Ornithinibacillus halophilus]|uniref:4-hydroxy-tetrahydrodipicolinate reductase n=1 Tax=Ornithinibacillus halophilus TaxID=930117 RepID=A0A1M5CNH7_9BACI|nr:4-hydroxy-tetrahydrodipicolinate reductase [Ornithinibacillus halophilus]SHF56315.1 dihydrodipicolinate reductase [Ornithinibacillus halophilus]
MTIKVIIAGPRGKMGSEAVKMVTSEQNLELVACVDRRSEGHAIREYPILTEKSIPVFESPEECLHTVDADVFIDLTVPEACFNHAVMAIRNNVRPVIGTSGLTNDQIAELRELAKGNEVGCIIAPNFALGAVLMMKFAQMAATYFPDIEIIEKHHDQKLDAPSGTAVKTAQLIKNTRKNKSQGHPDEVETMKGARGAVDEGIRIHSVRLPGLIAHQEVIFGGEGELLTIKHDSMNRQSFMTGVKFAVEKVMGIHSLVYGLENILD